PVPVVKFGRIEAQRGPVRGWRALLSPSDPPAVDKGAVEAVEVAHARGGRLDVELAVAPRDGEVGVLAHNADHAAVGTPDGPERRGGEGDLTPRGGARGGGQGDVTIQGTFSPRRCGRSGT